MFGDIKDEAHHHIEVNDGDNDKAEITVEKGLI